MIMPIMVEIKFMSFSSKYYNYGNILNEYDGYQTVDHVLA